MSSIPRILKSQVVSESHARKIAEIALYCAAIAIFVLGSRRLAVLELDEAGLFIGVLMICAVALLCTIAGLLVRGAPRHSDTPDEA